MMISRKNHIPRINQLCAIYLKLTFIFLLLNSSSNTEIRANTYTRDEQSNPSIIPASDGGFYIFWQTLNQIHSWEVYGQRFDKSHNKIGSETLINSVTNDDESQVFAITMKSGKIVIIYHTNQTGDFDIRMKIYDSNLNLLIPESVVNTITDADQIFPKLCAISDDTFLVPYLERRNNDLDIYAAIYDENKTLKKGSFLVNNYRSNNQGESGIMCRSFSDGKFIISYSSSYHPLDNSGSASLGIIYNSDYTVYKSEFLMYRNPSNDQNWLWMEVNRNQKLAAVWDSNITNQWDIYMRLMDINGNFLIEEKIINDFKGDNGVPIVFKSGWNNFLICWKGGCQSCSKVEVSCKLVDEKGNFLTNDMRISRDYPDNHINIRITQLNSLQNIITWQVWGQDGDKWGIYFDSFNGYQLVNFITENIQEDPYVNKLNNGGFLVTWTCTNSCESSNNNSNSCRGQIYDKFGNKVNSEFQINKTEANNQEKCRSATLSNNNILLIWQSEGQDRIDPLYKNIGIYGKIISESGTIVKDEFLINTSKSNTQYLPNVISPKDNLVVITWSSKHYRCNLNISCQFTIWSKFFDNGGNIVKEEFMINSQTTGNQDHSSLCVLKDNRILFVWHSDSNQDGDGLGIYGRITDYSGTFVSLEFKINKTTVGNQSNPSCAGLLDNRFVVTYESGTDIMGIIFNSDLTTLKDEFIINTYKTNTQTNSIVYSLNDGKFIIGWESNLQDGSNYGIYYQLFDSTGTPLGNETLASTMTFGDQKQISFTQSTSGAVIMSYSSYGDSHLSGIYFDFIIVCPDGRFSDNNFPDKCSFCDFKCATCNNKINCLTCANGYNALEDSPSVCLAISTCPNGYLPTPSNGICKKCDTSCINCTTSISSCSSCNNLGGYYNTDANPNTCSNIIPNGYYLDSTLKKYIICDISCSTCITKASNCTQCKTASLYYPKVDAINTCILKTASPNGFYFNSGTNQHEKCDVSCSACSTILNNCTLCNNLGGYYNTDANPNKCSNIILDGYYIDSNLKKIDICDISCLTCSNLKNSCNLCNTDGNYYPKADDTKACIPKNASPNGYYFDITTNKHEKCDVSCFTCVFTLKKCLICNNSGGYYHTDEKPNDCLNVLPEGYFIDSTLKKYVKCDVSCKTCTVSQSNCSICNNISLYYAKSDENNKCILKTNTPDGYYFDNTTNKHEKCNVSCLTCVTSASNCLICNFFGNYYSTIETPQTCLNSPPQGYFLDLKHNKYLKCDISCDGCTLNSFNCKKCNQINTDNSLKYYNTVTDPGACFLISNTPNYFYFSSIDKIFKQCDNSCRTCKNTTSYCLTCNTNYYSIQLQPSKCVINCPENTWKNFIDNYCSPCHESCKNCIDSTFNCIDCNEGFYPLEDNRKLCYKSCPAGYIFDQTNKICKKCSQNCESCNLDGSCSLCFIGNFLNIRDKKCYSRCDTGFYGNTTERVCVQCVSPCIECLSYNYCSSCIQDQYLNPLLKSNNCVTVCPDGYWANISTGKCELCDKKCKTCKNSSKNCQSCGNDFYYNKDTDECLILCPNNKYYNKENSFYIASLNNIPIKDSLKTCEKCNYECSTCKNSNDFCLTCGDGYFLVQSINNCVKVCPDGFYPDLTQALCQSCNLSCMTCKGPMVNDCLSCDNSSGKVLKNGSCITEGCPKGSIMLPNQSCFALAQCIDFANLSMPKIFNMESDPFIVKFTINLKNICDDYKKGFWFSWDAKSNFYDKAKFSADNSTYTIERDDMIEGPVNLKLDVLYDKNLFLASFNQTTILLMNKLIVKFKNEKPTVVYGFDIKIDASSSIDEGLIRSNQVNDPLLLFYWECPSQFQSLCKDYSIPKNENKILNFPSTIYSNVIKAPSDQDNYDFTLNLFKDKRSASQKITLIIKKPLITNSNSPQSNTTSTNNPKQDEEIDLTDLIAIEQNSIGMLDIIFQVSLLDPKIDLQKYQYTWNVKHFTTDDQYLNGKNEINLRIKLADLLNGLNKIDLKITDPKSKKEYLKYYDYEKNLPPYGGNCQVSPVIGYSLSTEFIFKFENWKSKSMPLFYKVKFQNSNNIMVDISEGGVSENMLISNSLPVADKFILEIVDIQGISSQISCYVKVKKNPNLPDIDSFLEKFFDTSKKLIMMDIYQTNKNSNEMDPAMLNNAINMVDNLFNDDFTQEMFLEKYESIVSTIITISNQNLDNDKINKIYKILKLIMKHVDPLLADSSKIEHLYKILDNLNKKAGNFLLQINNGDTTSIFEMLRVLQSILDLLNEKLFKNIVTGQNVIVVNNNFDNQMNKVSSNNPKPVCIDSSDTLLLEKKKNYRRIRKLNPNDSCDEESIMSLDKNLIGDLMKNETSDNLGFQSQYNKNKNLPIKTSEERQVFSETSLEFGLSTGASGKKMRRLEVNNLPIKFEIRLIIPAKRPSDNSTEIGATACVQYDKDKNKNPDVSCMSWYDDATSEVVCVCNKQGLTVNVMDKALSNLGKLAQFPGLGAEIFNPYSLGIVGTLIFILFFFYFLGKKFDEEDNKSKFYMKSENYDKMQYYIVKFSIEGFDKKYSFFSLYCYLIKNLHPLISLLHIYSPYYSRTLRVLDFFLSVYLSFFFTLLPFYYTDNSQLVSMSENRSIQNRNKTVNNLDASIKQILQGVIYSVMASVCSLIITTFLSLLLYQNVLIEEAQKKRLLLEKALKKNFHLIDNWQIKLTNASLKLQTILIITRSYRNKLMNSEKHKKGKQLKFQNNMQSKLSKNRETIDISVMQNIQNKSRKNSHIFKEIKNLKFTDNQTKAHSFRTKTDSEIYTANEKENINKRTNSINKENYRNKENSIEKNNNNFLNFEKSNEKYMNVNEVNLDELKINSKKLFKIPEERIIIDIGDVNSLSANSNKSFKSSDRLNYKLENINKYPLNNDYKNTILVKKKKKNQNFEKSEFNSEYNDENKQRIEDTKSKNKKILRKISADTKSSYFAKSKNDIFSNEGFFEENYKFNKLKLKKGALIIGDPKHNKQLTPNKNLIESSNVLKLKEEKKLKAYTEVNMQIEKCELCYHAAKINKYKLKKKLITIKKRGFLFPSNINIFTCNQITIINIAKLDYITGLIKTGIKTLIILFLYLYIWVYLMVFIQSIYKQYGKNIIKICIMPLISMLVIKLAITFNVMMFMTTLILYFWGDYYLNTIKLPIISMVIFKGLVPPLAFHHYSALKLFRELIKNN